MGTILDLVLVVIVALCAWRGFRAGIINGIFGILAVIIAIYGANLIAVTYSGEFTGMLEPFASGVVDSIETKIVDYFTGEDDTDTDFVPVAELDEKKVQDVASVSAAVLRQLGLSEGIADGIAQEVAESTEKVNAEMNDALTKKLCERLAYIAAFVIGFLLIVIVFSAIGNILDLAFGLPGLENLNHILGGILGAAKGIVIIVVLTCICRYLGLVLKTDIVENTWIMKRLMESNLLASILNI